MVDLADIAEELIKKYSVACPRYTSYPTAVEFSPTFDNSQWLKVLAQLKNDRSTNALSLYFHIPFCSKQCYFCACNRITPKNRSVVGPYLEALKKELQTYQEIIGGNWPVEQIHWGGGSPDYLNCQEINDLFGKIIEIFPNLRSDAEISVEIDPRTTTEHHLETFVKLGFNRLSIGVQDFDPVVQKIINRIQSYELTKKIVDRARSKGLDNINIDLIYGLPNQTQEGFEKTLEQTIKLKPSRIAMYGYAHVTWIKKTQKIFDKIHLPSPSERIQLFLLGLRKLTEAGYQYIGMDHFALPQDELYQALLRGKLNRNFMGYTTHRGSYVLGFGATAISLNPFAYAQNTKDFEKYERGVFAHGLSIERGIIKSEEDQLRAEIIEGILCSGIIDIKSIESKFNFIFGIKFEQNLASLRVHEQDGLITISKEKISLTPKGRVLARNIAMVFDSYLTKYQKLDQPVFSQAV